MKRRLQAGAAAHACFFLGGRCHQPSRQVGFSSGSCIRGQVFLRENPRSAFGSGAPTASGPLAGRREETREAEAGSFHPEGPGWRSPPMKGWDRLPRERFA